MAKPDLNKGWFMLAYELLPPLLMCCQRAEASVVLGEVLAQTYGRGKRKTAKVEPAKIAKRTGRTRVAIWKGVKELVDNGIIEKLGDGTYRFEKDYEKWGSDKKRLVNEPMAKYFSEFPDLAKRYEPDTPENGSVPSQGTASTKSHGKCVPREGTASTDRDESSVPPQGTQRVPQEGTVRVPPQGTVCVPPPITPPSTRESIENGESSSTCARIVTDRTQGEEHRKTIEHARAAYGDQFADVVLEMGVDIKLTLQGRFDCYRAAIDAAKQSARPIGNLHAFCIRTGGKFTVTGIPCAPIAVEPSIDRKGKPILTREQQAERDARLKAKLHAQQEPPHGR